MIIFWQLLSIVYFDLTLRCKKNVPKYPGKLNMTNGQILKNGRTSNEHLLWTEISNQWVSRYFRQWHMYSCLCLRPENCRSKTQVSSKFNILRMVRCCYGDDVTLKMCFFFLCCHVEDIPVMIGVGGRWGPVNVPWEGWWGGDLFTFHVTRQWLPMMLHWWCYDQAWSGCKAFIPKQLKVSQVWLNCTRVRTSGAISMGKPWHITLQNTQLLPSGYYLYPHWWEHKQRTNLPIQGLLSIYHESTQLYPPQTLVVPHSCKPTYPSYPMKYQQMYNGKMPILLTKWTKCSFWLVKQRSPYPNVIQYANFALQQS